MKNLFEKLFICLLTIAVTVLVPMDAAAAQDTGFALTADLATENGIFEYSFEWWQPEVPRENEFYISLPYSVKDSQVTVCTPNAENIVLDGKVISAGQKTAAPSRGAHTLVCGGEEYILTVFYGADIPGIYIETETGMDSVYADKNHKEPGSITILDGEKVEYHGVLDYIKGRGNTTWTQVKKPFNIKLDEKTDLFGMGKSKGWSLLANYVDVSLIKNKVAIDFADTVGLKYSSKSVIADLYIDSQYIGNYTLIEKVEIGDNRVEITNLEELNEEANSDIDIEECELAGVRGEESAQTFGSYKWVEIPNNPEDITGGYLLEYELIYRYDDEVSGFVSDYGQPIVLKSPEYASKAEVEYIRKYYQEFENAVLSDDGYNSQGKHYSEYIDVESMAKMYVFQEYVKNLDGGKTSFFLYKDTGGKFVASPVWDFDMALGHARKVEGIELGDSQGYLATGRRNNNDGYTIMSLMCRFPEFRQMAAQQWEEIFAPKIDALVEKTDGIATDMKASALMDKSKWTEGFARTPVEVAQWQGDKVIELKDFLSMRAKFMSKEFSSGKIYVSYMVNGGTGAMLDVKAYDVGERVEISENGFTNGDREFLGWNTAQDGSGTTYMPDEEFEITKNTALYAQWEKPSFFDMIAEFFASLF